MINASIFSSKTDDWAIHYPLFDKLKESFAFTLDVCASKENAKCDRYFTKEQDGLAQDWGDNVCWMNPPYGREISAWMEKAFLSSLSGATVVCLVPARTDTKWWHEFAMRGDVQFIKRRFKFGDAKSSAPFPSALVVFKAAYKQREAS